ncbi:hypothetical protein DY000_02004021 [Brassica cretica]|uniref:Uncharacterized protein n=1 Tax=Brassica cretica TaxID=69181 RepID=A0ABQ7CET8_BRACR|nr:hypothetical protein DY000_02004021 [Brassica cretica]
MRGENVIHTSVFRSLKGKPRKRAFVLHRFRYETLENSNRNLTRKKQLVGVRVRWNWNEKKETIFAFPLEKCDLLKAKEGGTELRSISPGLGWDCLSFAEQSF